MFSQVSSDKDAETVLVDNVLVEILHETGLVHEGRVASLALLEVVVLLGGLGLGGCRAAIFSLLVFDLLLLGDNVLEI